MDEETAKALLVLGGDYDEEAVKRAYRERVKGVRSEPNFENTLPQLNVARDSLLEILSGSRELVPVLARELAAISAKQNELALVNDARDEIRSALGTIENRVVNRIKGTRDLTGLLSAASAALAFGRENLSELIPTLTGVTLYSQTLLLASACLAFMAFMANRRAGIVATRMDEIKQQLTRDRQISRLLGRVFVDQTSLDEQEFEERLAREIRRFTGTSREPSAMSDILEIYGLLGMPVPVRIRLGHYFIDDYIDYLIKSGRIKVSGTSGNDMMIHKLT